MRVCVLGGGTARGRPGGRRFGNDKISFFFFIFFFFHIISSTRHLTSVPARATLSRDTHTHTGTPPEHGMIPHVPPTQPTMPKSHHGEPTWLSILTNSCCIRRKHGNACYLVVGHFGTLDFNTRCSVKLLNVGSVMTNSW